MPDASDVVEVMNQVVDEIPRERLDCEHGSVAAAAGPRPLITRNALEPRSDHVRSLAQAGHHDGRILFRVTVRNSGRVLVPVGVLRPVKLEHQPEPLVIQPEHVADMAAVLQRRPDPWRRAAPQIARPGEQALPRRRVDPDHPSDGLARKALRVQAALWTGAP